MTTMDKIRALMSRNGWTQRQTSTYLGVPHGTLCNWLQGVRVPGPMVGRLIDVLAIVEMVSPAIHATIISPPQADHPPRVRKKVAQ